MVPSRFHAPQQVHVIPTAVLSCCIGAQRGTGWHGTGYATQPLYVIPSIARDKFPFKNPRHPTPLHVIPSQAASLAEEVGGILGSPPNMVVCESPVLA